MSARSADSRNGAAQPRKRRHWLLRVLFALVALVIIGAIVAAYFLQPTKLTALILEQASNAMKLELHTSGPGSYALRPEPRLVLPGLSATIPGDATPFFRSAQIELALPWATLRGRSTNISSIVLKSPDLDVTALQRWLATQQPSTTAVKFPTLTRGLQIDDAQLRAANWRITHLDIAMPSLADGAPNRLDASGILQRGAITSKFALALASTPTGIGHGLRIDNMHMKLTADGELPSLTAAGNMRASDTFAIDLAGAFQHIPAAWSKPIDSSFAKPGDIPYSIVASNGVTAANSSSAALVSTTQDSLRLRLKLGDAARQPALTLNVETSRGETLNADLHGQLSRWPDAWPGLPTAIASNAMPIVFSAKYQGSLFLLDPVVFDMKRAGTSLQGQFHIAELHNWIKHDYEPLLPPIEATLITPQFDVGGMQLRSVQLDIHDDPAPAQPATKPSTVTPKS